MTYDEIAMLNDLLDVTNGLSAWEVDFIEDLDKTRGAGNGNALTEKQHDKLFEIGERVF